MKKIVLLFVILLISANAFAMGERVDYTKTQTGTPIFGNAPAQYSYAQKKLTALEEAPSSINVQPAANAFRDFRELFPNDPENVTRSYFYEAKSYYLGNEFKKFNEVYAQFIEKNASMNTLTALQAEGSVMTGSLLQKQGLYQEALTALAQVEKDFPQEKVRIIEARRAQYSCYETLGNVSESITVLEDTVKNYPVNDYDLAFFNLNIGLAYQKLGNMPKTIEALQKVISLPETPKNKGPKLAAKLMYEALQKNK